MWLKRSWGRLKALTRRRGWRYFGYLISGVVWPAFTYRWVWGPTAPPILQGLSTSAAMLTGDKTTAIELRRLGLLADENSPTIVAGSAAEVEKLMDRAHAEGVAGIGSSLRNLAQSGTGELRFASLSDARRYQRGTLRFAAARDVDRRAFNREFGATLLTEETARQSLRDFKARVPSGYREYAPIDFGCGLTIGSIASTDSGTGRWEFFNQAIVAPLVSGKRVLDLGCNNGSLSLMMLRAGAREVVGIEYTPTIAELARLNARILSWRDVRSYCIDVITGDMRLFLTTTLGGFDVVTAFCSLYYLPEEDMARIIAKAAALNAVLVLQANDVITNLLASATDLRRLMLANGYPTVEVYHAADFSRPLLVGVPVHSHVASLA